MTEKSLTQPPTNLKDAIDWIALVGAGYGSTSLDQGKRTELKSALDKLLSWSSLRSQLKINVELDGLILKLANGLGPGFLGYNATTTISGSGIAQSGVYQSTYRDAQWFSQDEEKCAMIFLGAASMVFYGLSFLYLQCKMSHGGWKDSQLTDTGSWGLGKFMADMGFNPSRELRSIQGSAVASRLDDGGANTFEELKTAYGTSNSIYPNFLDTLVQQNQPSALNYPLTNCHKIATHYFKSVFKNSETNDNTLQKIKQAFQTFKGSCGNYHRDFTEAISGFINSSMTLTPSLGSTTSSSQSSSAGPLAGTLTTFGIGGGAAAAYILNLTSPIITGGGILPANVAKPQVCNAVLNFVIRFLEGLCGITVLGGNTNKEDVTKVIGTLRKCVGTGQVPRGFKELVEKIEGKVQTNSGFQSGVGSKLKEMFGKLKDIVNKNENGDNVENLETFLEQVITSPNNEQSNDFQNLCDELKNLFEDRKIKTSPLSEQNHLTLQDNSHKSKVTTQANRLKPSKFDTDLTKALAAGVQSGALAFLAEIKEPMKYTSYYDKPQIAKWPDSDGEQKRCAKIFLGCLPLYYQALTYIYWGCHDKGGGWRNLTLANGALRSYFDSQGLLPLYVDKSKRGAHIAESALKGFSEFTQGMREATSSPPLTYASFANKLLGLVKSEQHTTFPSHANIAVRAPKTIHEMLYFLAALQFSPQYDAFDGYVTEYFKGLHPDLKNKNDDSELKLQVADSGTSAKGNTLSAADLKSYLASTFHLAPAFIGLIQEPSTTGEPWLHSLFSNSQFKLSIPSSGAGIFSALSNYAYALQFQLSFLYIQCRNTYTKACGWNQCTFGQKINSDIQSQIVPSHICPVGCTNTKHNPPQNHATGCEHKGCGTANDKPSPLQAFLTDNLKGFGRGHPSDPSSHLASCSGQMCHVPMGFKTANLRSAPGGQVQGLNIAYALGSFCGGFNTPLRQLCEKLTCLTKRTPRTLGDLFGFVWHLNGQLYNTRNSNPVTQSWVNKLANLTPFSSTVKDHLDVLKTLVGTGHTDSHGTADLTSLYSSGCNQQNQNCGPYLYPLTHSDGATFGKPAPYASTYLSWVLYLTDELYESLQEFLDTFNGHACKNCTHRCAHSTASPCSCP
ncbi:uncharacterized protein BcabD6B2_22230 [Babesia caballi]|uniref:Uncharacterized protein n=1 Tax=Babesia caballi TaxID=5871 RepID=A0AAV4LRJ2_BABCB|nr:hypothetical protein, conserved [Babesia caballi]